MSSFSEFSKHADHLDEPQKDAQKNKVNSAKVDPMIKNQSNNIESSPRNFNGGVGNAKLNSRERSQNNNQQQTSRL